jgi:hypothetical protein
VQVPAFPDACCYCGDPAHDTIPVKVGGVELSVPYCEEHLAPASEYVNKVIPRFVKAHLIYCTLGAIAFAIAAATLFELPGLALQILVGAVVFFVGFILMAKGGGDLWTRPVLKRGSRRLGFTDPAKVAPGILTGSATEEPARGKVRLELVFADDSYADLFEAKLQATA